MVVIAARFPFGKSWCCQQQRGGSVRRGRLGPKVGPSPPPYGGETSTLTAPRMNSSSYGLPTEPGAAPDCADAAAGLEGRGRNKTWDQCL